MIANEFGTVHSVMIGAGVRFTSVESSGRGTGDDREDERKATITIKARNAVGNILSILNGGDEGRRSCSKGRDVDNERCRDDQMTMPFYIDMAGSSSGATLVGGSTFLLSKEPTSSRTTGVKLPRFPTLHQKQQNVDGCSLTYMHSCVQSFGGHLGTRRPPKVPKGNHKIQGDSGGKMGLVLAKAEVLTDALLLLDHDDHDHIMD